MGGNEGRCETTVVGVRNRVRVCVCVCLTPEKRRGSREIRASEGRKSRGAEGR